MNFFHGRKNGNLNRELGDFVRANRLKPFVIARGRRGAMGNCLRERIRRGDLPDASAQFATAVKSDKNAALLAKRALHQFRSPRASVHDSFDNRAPRNFQQDALVFLVKEFTSVWGHPAFFRAAQVAVIFGAA
jgi:hypothetical protein